MEEKKPKKEIASKTYWFVFSLGVVYIILLGIFTFLFNSPA